MREIQRSDPRVVLVDLSRNFGHHQAAVAGLAQARGRRVFIIDVDLEEQPEWLAGFAEEHDRTRADVVFGVSAVRRGTAFRRQAGTWFWKLFNLLSDVKVPANPCTVRLMSRRYVDALLTMPEKNLFLAGSYAWLGFEQVPLVVQKLVRPTRSSYTIRRLRLAVPRRRDVVHQLPAAPHLPERRRSSRSRRCCSAPCSRRGRSRSRTRSRSAGPRSSSPSGSSAA